MNNEEKKQYLRRYQAAKKRAKMIQEEIDELRSSKTSPVDWETGCRTEAVHLTCPGMPHDGMHSCGNWRRKKKCRW